MKIYPAIDLHNGNAVRLYKGDYNNVTVYGDALAIAQTFKESGADFIHVVDLDGAKEGLGVNLEVIKKIINNVDIDIEVGGGIRTLADAKKYLELGVKRVIIGSKALDLEFVKKLVDTFGSDKIVVGIDCRNMKIATHGWLKDSNIDAVDFSLKLKAIGIKTIIFTDIAQDGTLSGINIASTKKMVDEVNIDIVASGGAKDINDVLEAKRIGCSGIILGKSLYEKKIDLGKAIRCLDAL